MSLVTFPLRVQPELKEAIRDRAMVENRTQTDLIREAIQRYLVTGGNNAEIVRNKSFRNGE